MARIKLSIENMRVSLIYRWLRLCNHGWCIFQHWWTNTFATCHGFCQKRVSRVSFGKWSTIRAGCVWKWDCQGEKIRFYLYSMILFYKHYGNISGSIYKLIENLNRISRLVYLPETLWHYQLSFVSFPLGSLINNGVLNLRLSSKEKLSPTYSDSSHQIKS